MKKNAILSLALAGTMGLSAIASPAVAVEAAPSSVSDFDSLISDLSSEESEVSEKLSKIQNEIEENETEAENLVAEMKDTESLLDDLRVEIEDLKVVIGERESQLEDQARALQIVGESGNIVNFLLDADSFDELIGRVDVVSTLISSNKDQLSKQKEDKDLVEEKETETVEKQEDQAKLAGKLESNKAILAEREAEQEQVLAELASEKANAKEERETMVARAKEAEQRRQEMEEAREQAANAGSDSDRSSEEESSSETSGEVTPASSNSSSDSSSNSSSDSSSDSSSNDDSSSSKSEKKKESAPSANGNGITSDAHSLSGVPYSYGGGSTSGFDCSGFTSYVFSQNGRSLPRTASGQYASTSRISESEAQPGDLVFFNQGGGVDHVGIYLGNGKFIGSQTSTGVAVSTIDSGYWSNYVAGFGR